jgi:type I restriction enzyme R subunit
MQIKPPSLHHHRHRGTDGRGAYGQSRAGVKVGGEVEGEGVRGVGAAVRGEQGAIVIYNNLPLILAGGVSMVSEPSPNDEMVRAVLALNIDRAMREHAPAGWKGDETREKQVLNALFPIMSLDRQATQALFELIKNQPGD